MTEREYIEIEAEVKNSTLPLQTQEKILNACMKQVAMGTKVIDKVYDDARECPSCSKYVEYGGKTCFCTNCGQKIDWK